MSDHYQTLGIDRSSSSDDIKKAYRKLASKHHPDKGGDKEKFQEIQKAYDILSDDNKRQEYDNPQPQGFHFDFNGPGGFEHMFGQGHPFGDIFGFRQQRRPQTNRNVQLQTTVSLEDAFNGKEVIANITLPSGKEQTVNIKIPPGIHEGTTLRLAGMGDDAIAELPRGDILLNVQILPHAKFVRQGDDLFQEVTINSINAILGTTITLTSIDDKQLETNIPAGIQYGTMIGLPGYGMPNFNTPANRGRLIVKVKIETPELSEEQKDNLRKLNIV